MEIIRSPKRMQKTCIRLKQEGETIGFVPTMGYLHEGHLSLMRIAKRKSDVLVVSIFVNPTQFGPQEDFKRYPRDFKRDKKLLRDVGCSFLFSPSIKDMYPVGYKTHVEVCDSAKVLEGTSRPGHFKGVTTIVAKLFNIVQPDIAVFGQKDAQQAVVLKKMVADLNYGIKILIAPTIRGKNGLALSSRNSYLSVEERNQAAVLYQALNLAKKMVESGKRDSGKIKNRMKKLILGMPKAKIDYIAMNDWETLEPLKKLKGEVLISLAVRFGKTRLIDNIKMKVS
jgi:pantoate--beta-alanine ligase